jgi:DNA-binding transcriptional ArsR family regulator/uncharacterized protein YndB with AHSA1/START domain
MLNQQVEDGEVDMADDLSTTFAALADPTRRAILARLAEGEATVNELADPFAISLQAVSKHLKVLEAAGLVTRGRTAQWRPVRLRAAPLAAADDWIERYRALWETASTRSPTTSETSRRARRHDRHPSGTVRSIRIERELDAPRELVYRAWTDPAQFAVWFGGHQARLEDVVMDVRSRRCVERPDGARGRPRDPLGRRVRRARRAGAHRPDADRRPGGGPGRAAHGRPRGPRRTHPHGGRAARRRAHRGAVRAGRAGWEHFFDVMAELLAPSAASSG